MKKNLFLTLAIIPLLSGCYYSQPGNVGGDSGMNGTTAMLAGAGAVGGAAAGNAINKDYGAPVGAAVGGIVVGGATAIFQNRQARDLAEAYETGKREGRAFVYNEWWDDIAIFNDPMDQVNKKGPKTRQIQVPAGTYESVPYDNRSYEAIVSPNSR